MTFLACDTLSNLPVKIPAVLLPKSIAELTACFTPLLNPLFIIAFFISITWSSIIFGKSDLIPMSNPLSITFHVVDCKKLFCLLAMLLLFKLLNSFETLFEISI